MFPNFNEDGSLLSGFLFSLLFSIGLQKGGGGGVRNGISLSNPEATVINKFSDLTEDLGSQPKIVGVIEYGHFSLIFLSTGKIEHPSN